MNTVIRSTAAESDLEDIVDYIAAEAGPVIAEKIAREIYARFSLLEEQPEIGRARPEIGDGVRSFTASDYLIFYRIKGEEIEIGRILHGTRDVDAEFKLVPFQKLFPPSPTRR